MKKNWIYLWIVVALLTLRPLYALGQDYSQTIDFDLNQAFSWNTNWKHTLNQIPQGAVIQSASITLRVKVWYWGSNIYEQNIDIMASDTISFSLPQNRVCELNPSTNPSVSNFYTVTCPLSSIASGYIENDGDIHVGTNTYFGTYYIDYSTLTVSTTLTPPTTHTLAITKTGTGTGTVTGAGTYTEGVVQAIVATANTGSTFTGWSGNVDCSDGSVTMDQDKTCIATFTLNAATYYRDSDNDGYGDPDSPYEATSQLSGFVADNNDCIDYDPSIHPGATEICGDGIDQDCNGSDCPSLLTQTQVSQLYVSIFGRASEGEGNAYWSSEQDNMTTAAYTMLDTDAAKAYFGDTLNDNQAFIEFIYENTLGKTYAEDPAGVDYWVGELTAGKSKGQVVATLINAAIDPQYAGLPAQDQFLNKVIVSNYTADKITTVRDVNDLSAFVNFISGVTNDVATVEAAKAAVDAF